MQNNLNYDYENKLSILTLHRPDRFPDGGNPGND